jgi:hypothetical protein
MNSARSIIADIRGDMRNRWNGANGSKGYRNVTGPTNLANIPGRQTNKPGGWNAQGSSNAFVGSPKYILQVSNSSNSTFTGSFDVLGAAIYLFGNNGGGTWSADGNLTVNGITISCVYGTVNYQSVLTSSMANPFTVGGVYLETISGTNGQVSQIYTINSQDAGGSAFQSPIKPYIDPNQFQPNITYNTTSFNMDSLTRMTWNTIFAATVFQISLFPATVINPTQALNQGGTPATNYRPGQLIGTLK